MVITSVKSWVSQSSVIGSVGLEESVPDLVVICRN
jgi:hypothetical protein